MCFGESSSDTFRQAEISLLERSAAEQIPGYKAVAHSNGAISWVVLEPDELTTRPRFTICRIDPCIVVMVEEGEARRFVSVASPEDAIVIARRAVNEAAAMRNVHRAPETAQ